MSGRETSDEARLVAAVLHAFEEAGTDYEPVLDLVCELGAELTGDPWVIRLVDDEGCLYLAAVAGEDPETVADLRAVIEADRVPYAESLAAAILRDGSPMLLPPNLVGLMRTGRHQHVGALMIRRGFSGGVIAPLRVRGQVIGTIWWICQHHHGQHDDDDLHFASAVADRCALAIDNARLVRSLRAELDDRTRAEERHSRLLAHVSDAVVVVDGAGVITQITAGVERVLGWSSDIVVGSNVFDYVHPDDHAHALERFLEVLGPDELPATTVRIRHATGEWRHVEVSGDNLLDDPAVGGVVITAHDVTERWWADALLGDENEVLDLVARGADLTTTLNAICSMMDARVGGVSTVWLLDDERGELVSVVGPGVVAESRLSTGSSSLGTDGAQWVNELPEFVLVSDPSTDPYWAEWRDEAKRFGIRCSWTYVIRDAEARHLGALIVYRVRMSEPDGRQQQVTELAARLVGVAVHRELDARNLAYAATHDSVTGAGNRALFVDRLHAAVARQRQGAEPPAVLFIDLDRFKELNDRAGHAAGDAALRVLAGRLQAAVRPNDVVARFGGDEFSVLCEETSEEMAVLVADRLLATIGEPIEVAGRTHRVTASIGLAVGRTGVDAETIVRRADLAMYRAKSIGRSRVVRFQTSLLAPDDVAALERDLRAAIEADEITLHFQPIVDLHTGRWAGVEALARWDHPERGPVAPETFVAIAEEAGLGGALGERVLDRTCAQGATWRDDPVMTKIVVGANVSGQQLSDPAFTTALARRLAASGMDPRRLILELTETTMMEDYDAALLGLQSLRELGVAVTIDDFGTGHSTLARLRQFPAVGVKLDRSFIVELGNDRASEDIVAAVVQLAHAVGMIVCAEGIESAAQLAVLQRLGVDAGQGFYLARPAPADEIRELFRRPPTALRPGHLKIAE